MSADNLFRQLEPPRGGVEHFARRLDEADASSGTARRLTLALAGAASAAAVALVVAVVLLRAPDEPVPPIASSSPTPEVYDAPEFDRLLGRPLRTEELTAVVDKQTASLTELESQNEKVRIYQIN